MKNIATESQEQMALIEWAQLTKLSNSDKVVGDYLFHIPNQGKRTLRNGYDFVKMGLKKGVPDLFFAYPYLEPAYEVKDTKMIYKEIRVAGLFIEMKRKGKSVIHSEQKKIMELFESVGYKCIIAYGWEQARDEILEYLG